MCKLWSFCGLQSQPGRAASCDSFPGTHSRQVQRVADPQAHPVVPGHDGRQQQLSNVQLQEEREERVGVDVERVRPVGGTGSEGPGQRDCTRSLTIRHAGQWRECVPHESRTCLTRPCVASMSASSTALTSENNSPQRCADDYANTEKVQKHHREHCPQRRQKVVPGIQHRPQDGDDGETCRY